LNPRDLKIPMSRVGPMDIKSTKAKEYPGQMGIISRGDNGFQTGG